MLPNLIRPEIRALSAYHVPDPENCIKLDAMENPYHWLADLVDAWLEKLKTVEINRYPDPAAKTLTAQLRNAMEIPESANVVLGNGSDELIQMILMAVSGKDRVVLAPEPTFVMYKMTAQFVDMPFVGVPLDEHFQLDLSAMLDAIEQHQPAVIFLAYPNNPTGNLFDVNAIEQILQVAPGFVVVDEAYHVFAKESFMPRLDEFPNLLVMRTVSKMGLAGLRLGLLAGAAKWIDEINKVRLPYNINVLTQATASFILEHEGVLQEQARLIREARTALMLGLSEIDGVEHVYPSRANFILFRVNTGTATALFERLKTHGVLVKNLDGAGSSLKDCLRVTVSTPEENRAFLSAMRKS